MISTGQPYTSNGPFSAGIAYLQTGSCLFNGEGCSLLEMTLGNPTCAGCGSSSDISLIPPHAFNVPVAFSYSNGCDGQGAACNTPGCSTAFYVPDDTTVQVACQTDNVNLVITFCGDGSGNSTASSSEPASSPSSTVSTVAAPSPTSSAVQASSSAPAISSSAVVSAPVNVVSAAPSSSSVPDRGTCKTGASKRDARARRSQNVKVHRRQHASH